METVLLKPMDVVNENKRVVKNIREGMEFLAEWATFDKEDWSNKPPAILKIQVPFFVSNNCQPPSCPGLHLCGSCLPPISASLFSRPLLKLLLVQLKCSLLQV